MGSVSLILAQRASPLDRLTFSSVNVSSSLKYCDFVVTDFIGGTSFLSSSDEFTQKSLHYRIVNGDILIRDVVDGRFMKLFRRSFKDIVFGNTIIQY